MALGLMIKNFANLEKNLRRAGYVLLLEIIACILLAIVLPIIGIRRDWIVPFVWLANLPVVWFLAQAAKHQGRSAWLSALVSIPPLLALFNFLSLWSTARFDTNEA